MPKAFCGLEMCAKNLRELCALCERKNSPAWEKKLPKDLLHDYFHLLEELERR